MQLEEYALIISSMINKLQPLHVLDYGCGQGIPLAAALKKAGISCAFKYQAFDADVPKLSDKPFPADIVLCTRLLGKDEDAEDTLDELQRVTECVGLFVVSKSSKPTEWWMQRLMSRFDLQTFQVVENDSFYVVVYAQPRMIENLEGEKLS